MSRVVAKRLALLPVTAWVVATIVFFVLHVIPGSAVDTLISQGVTGNIREQIIKSLALDKPLVTQYLTFLKGVVGGNLGRSFYSGQTVDSLLKSTIPVTIELAVASVILMVCLGITIGMIAARYRGTPIDTTARFIATLFFSMPWFWLGILLIIIFGVELHILPTFGRLPPGLNYQPKTNFIMVDAIIEGRPDLIGPWLEYLLLPALAVGLSSVGFVTRITRASFIDTMLDDYARTARMKGLPEGKIFWRHIFRNAAVPIITIAGLQFGALLGGAVITEVVFSYPGVGQLMVNAIIQRDYPVVEGAALVIAFMYILVNTLTDISYMFLDPRLRDV